jgi:hypothetical protein
MIWFGTNAKWTEGSWYDDDQGWDTGASGNVLSETEPDQEYEDCADSISDTSGTPPTAEELAIAANLMEAQIMFSESTVRSMNNLARLPRREQPGCGSSEEETSSASSDAENWT